MKEPYEDIGNNLPGLYLLAVLLAWACIIGFFMDYIPKAPTHALHDNEWH